MAKVKTQVNAVRVAEMAGQIRSIVLSMADEHREMLGHEDAKRKLGADILVTKLDIAQQIADLSADHEWLPDEIDLACKRAAEGNDDEADARTQKTMGVVCSEMRTVAHPKVRERFRTIHAACKEAWDAEVLEAQQASDDMRKHLDQPVHRFSKRLYNLVISISRAVRDDKARISDPQDLIDYCVANDPNHDEDKIAQRVQALIGSLESINADFDNDKLKLAIEYLTTISAKELLASREAMLEAARDAVGDEPVVAPSIPKPAPKLVPVAQAPAPVQTTSQAIDDLLNDNLEMLAAD
jgi:hypothetical protein